MENLKTVSCYLLQFFDYQHLPTHLQDVSKPFFELANAMNERLPNNPEKSTAIRKLLESRDCAVRAILYNPPAEEKTRAGEVKTLQEEIRLLREANYQLLQEVDALKDAATYG